MKNKYKTQDQIMINALREMSGHIIHDKKRWLQSRTLYAKKIAEKKKQERENNKAIEEFLNNGGKITLCPPKIN